MQSAMSSFAATVVTSPPVVEAATSLVNTLLATPSVISASSSLAADVVATPPVLAATANALSAGAIDAVARPVVIDAARELVVGLVAQLGDALTSAFSSCSTSQSYSSRSYGI